MEKQMKLQKYIADCGLMSRRAAEREIELGAITVNGEVATIGLVITPGKDRVVYRGKPIVKKRGEHASYIMLNKPTGYITTMSDDKGRKTVADLIADTDMRLYPIGRLDMDSEGLLLCTNDGDLANALTHPRHRIAKYYEVTVEGQVMRQTLIKLSGEMTIDGYAIQPVNCAILKRYEDRTVISMELFEGRNRQIRKMCELCELTVKKLKRVAIGELELDVAKGKWRFLNKNEVDYLKEACGLLDKAAEKKNGGAKKAKTSASRGTYQPKAPKQSITAPKTKRTVKK